MKKLIYLLLFVATIGLAGLAIAQTDDSNNTNPPATTTTTGSSTDHSSSSHDTAGRHSVIGIVVSISEIDNTIVLSNVETPSSTYSSSHNEGSSSGSTATTGSAGSTGSTGAAGSVGTGSTDSSAMSLNQTFQLTGSTEYSKGKASDIKAGDKVRLELDSANLVQSVTVISK